MSIPEKNLAQYEKLIAAFPKLDRKGASIPYTSMNGHMFSFLTPEGSIALRLPEEAREAFMKKYKTKLCEQHGRVMKEYVLVPNALLGKTAEIKKHFATSVDYVGSLKPKPTKKKKPAKKAAKKKAAKKKATRKK